MKDSIKNKVKIYLNEVSNKIKGGLSDGMTENDLAKKYGVSVNVIKRAINAGIKVELEHTSDKSIAKEIAMDHIYEDLHYYEKLKKVEKS